jgi:predicted nucleic-acid-binding protein
VKGRVGLDTNVILRWLSHDPGARGQSERAAHAVEGIEGTIHINIVVLAELLWLASKILKAGREEQAQLLHRLLESPGVELAERSAIEAALSAYESGGGGFVDHLIGALNAEVGCSTTLTFDKTAAKSAFFTEPA